MQLPDVGSLAYLPVFRYPDFLLLTPNIMSCLFGIERASQ